MTDFQIMVAVYIFSLVSLFLIVRAAIKQEPNDWEEGKLGILAVMLIPVFNSIILVIAVAYWIGVNLNKLTVKQLFFINDKPKATKPKDVYRGVIK